jgi:hypothetical protein
MTNDSEEKNEAQNWHEMGDHLTKVLSIVQG